MEDSRVSVSVILAVKDDDTGIADLVRRARAVEMDRVLTELLVINDGSADATHQACQDLTQHIDIYERQPHQGKDAAVRAGVARALGEVILVLDSNSLSSPNDYSKMLEPILAGQADVVLARRSRASGVGHSAFRVEVFEGRHLAETWGFESGFENTPLDRKWRVREVALS